MPVPQQKPWCRLCPQTAPSHSVDS
uniref:Uncharacterized protein n=1 Tax=Arundo donax TaxID=35708 RepID=A0A0A9DMN2_ARUDO